MIAAAGASKTQFIIDQIVAHPEQRILVTTYTIENLSQIEARLAATNGGILPVNVTVVGWFGLLVNQCIRPYQRSVFGEANYVGAFNFLGEKSRYARKDHPQAYFLDGNRAVYRDGAADLACEINRASGGLVTKRLSDMYDVIYIDELQDLAGYDLELVDLLIASPLRVVAVGDPRQQTFVTNRSRKNSSAKGDGLMGWVNARTGSCEVVIRDKCDRSNQAICDFADSLYPHMPRTIGMNTEVTGHDGIFGISRSEVMDYVDEYSPTVLRWNRASDTMGLPAKNFGVSKGSTYDRVLIFPTVPMLKYFKTGDLSKLAAKEKFYVAVTRARYSVAYVAD